MQNKKIKQIKETNPVDVLVSSSCQVEEIAETILNKFGWTLLNRVDAEEARGLFAAVALRCGCDLDRICEILGCSMAAAVAYKDAGERSLRQREEIRKLEIQHRQLPRSGGALAPSELNSDAWAAIVEAVGRPISASERKIIRRRFARDIAGREIPSDLTVSCLFGGIESADNTGVLELSVRSFAVDSYAAGDEEAAEYEALVTAGLFPVAAEGECDE